MEALADLAGKGEFFVIDRFDSNAYAAAPVDDPSEWTWVSPRRLAAGYNGFSKAEAERLCSELRPQLPGRDLIVMPCDTAMEFAAQKGWL